MKRFFGINILDTHDKKHYPLAVERLFHWRISQALVPVFFGTGAAMALNDRFHLAYFFFCIFLLWTLAQWFTSDFLLEQKRKSEKSPRKSKKLAPELLAEIKKQKLNRYRLIKWGGMAFFAAMGLACILVTGLWETQWELKQLNGVLYPANDPDPPGACDRQDIPASALKVYLGGQEVVGEGKRVDVISLNRDPEPRLVLLGLDRAADGTVALKANIFGEDNKLIVQIDSNHFQINRNRILDSFSPPRPDRSTIRITDDGGNHLTVRFLNKQSITFVGKLYFRPGRYVEIDGSGIHIKPGGTQIVPGFCTIISNPEGAGFIGLEM